MRKIRSLLRNERGSNLIEFAIALPVLVSLVWGIFQVGLVFWAQAGVSHALGEAARLATIWPYPGDDAIRAKVAARKFGTNNGTLDALDITDNTTGSGASLKLVSKDLTLTYSQPTHFLFVAGPTVRITKTKRVYLAS